MNGIATERCEAKQTTRFSPAKSQPSRAFWRLIAKDANQTEQWSVTVVNSGQLQSEHVMTIPQKGIEKFSILRPSDDNRDRLVCGDCGWIHYENPRVIVGAVVRHGDQILFCRRAIRPRYGYWTVPGGFMELGESPEEGAAREVYEEAGASVAINGLLGVYAVPRIGQVHLIYLATLIGTEFQSGSESLDTKLFPATQEGIPWDDLAFPVNHWTLRDFLTLNGREVSTPFTAKPEDLMQRMSKIDYHPDFPPPDLAAPN